ncbi:MAG: hypothetical protein GY828_06080 [Candidatus Gracilibacteria bacterium]|nr:hypothetical protein [Candidatus Gracilibacteria bacterium]
MKKYIIPSSMVLLIVVGLLLITFKNTSDEQSVQTHIQPEVKIETKSEIETKVEVLSTGELLTQLEESVLENEDDETIEEVILPEPEVIPVEKLKPVVIPVPKIEPKVNTTQPDFQPSEYFRNSEDEAPTVYHYNPKPEWFIPNGNPEDFSLDKKGIRNAYGKNYKNLSLSFHRDYLDTSITTLSGFTDFIENYTNNKIYFVGDNEEGEQRWSFHVEASSIEIEILIERIRNDNRVKKVKYIDGLLPQFKDRELEIESQTLKYMEL